MAAFKTRLRQVMLDTLYYSGASGMAAPWTRGVGVIFTLHHVRAEPDARAFAPNGILEITGDFLDAAIRHVRTRGYEIVSLDDVVRRLRAGEPGQPFACFTFDDGYRDVATQALPVFEKHNAPFALYVTTGHPERKTVMWWSVLEDIVRGNEEVDADVGGRRMRLAAGTPAEKYRAFEAIYWPLRALSHAAQYATILKLADHYQVDPLAPVRATAISWGAIQALAASPLVTIGVHTVNHYALSKLPPDAVRDEAQRARNEIGARIGRDPRHFCYPYGDRGSAARREFELIRELGFLSATTTRKGVLFPEHAQHLHALPRVSLNGDYQRLRYLDAFLTGAPFALARGFRKLDVD